MIDASGMPQKFIEVIDIAFGHTNPIRLRLIVTEAYFVGYAMHNKISSWQKII